MMEIYFSDPEDIPLPPDEVRIRQFHAVPYPDGKRVKVYLELTPFLQRPNAELNITNSRGVLVSSLNVIETIDPNMEFTMHLREAKSGGQYSLKGVVFYTQSTTQDTIPAFTPDSSKSDEPTDQFLIVDETIISFEI